MKSFLQKLAGPLGLGLGIVAGATVILVIFWRVITEPGTPPGADPTSFAHTAKVFVDYFRQTHHLPPIDLSWYAGFEHIAAPPFITFILGFFYYITHDIFLSVRLFQPMATFFFFLSMVFLMKKEGYPNINALIAGMVFAFMPTIFNTYGSSTKMVALFLLPFAFYFTNKILVSTEVKYFGALALMIALVILAHPMTGVVFAMYLGFYSLLYAYLDSRVVTRRFLFVWLSLFLGFLLCGAYVVPFFLEKINRTAIAAEEATIVVNLATMYRDFKIQVGGALFLILPLYVIWREKSAKLAAIFLTGLGCMVIYFGYYFGFGHFFPFSLSYNYIWFFMTAFAYSYLLGLMIPFRELKDAPAHILRWLLGIIFVAFYIYSASFYLNLANFKNLGDDKLQPEYDVSDAINKIANTGRVYPSHYPFGLLNWVLFLDGNKPNIEGHYFGIAKIGKKIAVMADAIHNDYPRYVTEQMEHLNVRYFIANAILREIKDDKGKNLGKEMIKELKKEDFKLVFTSTQKDSEQNTLYQLYYQDKLPTYLMPVDEKILIIGQYNSTLNAAISASNIKALEGGSDFLDDYNMDILKHFPTVILYGFGYHDKARAEELARTYVSSGGNLVIDLFNMDDGPLAGDPTFLGVQGMAQKIHGTTDIEAVGQGNIQEMVPKSFALPSEVVDLGNGVLTYVPMKEWNSLEYANLDESFARLGNEPDIFSVLGYKNVQGAKVTFVGMNFFYHLYLTHDAGEQKFVERLINKSQDADKTPVLANITQEAWTAENSRFKINADKENLYLISLAYSPHWHGYLDGKPIKITNMENLMMADIPAGEHTLELKYEPTPISILGWLTTGATAVFLVGLVIFFRYHNRRKSEA